MAALLLINPFQFPTSRGSYRNHPNGGHSIPSSIHRFPQVGGIQVAEAPRSFRPTTGDEGMKTLPPNDSSRLTQSTSRRSPPFFQIRLATNPVILFKSSQTPDPVRMQGPSKTKSWPWYPVSVKERNRKGGKCKISRVLQSPVPSTKPHLRWRPVIDLNRLNTFLYVEKFKMETPESIRTSLIPGQWVSSIDLSDAYLHILTHPTQGNT